MAEHTGALSAAQEFEQLLGITDIAEHIEKRFAALDDIANRVALGGLDQIIVALRNSRDAYTEDAQPDETELSSEFASLRFRNYINSKIFSDDRLITLTVADVDVVLLAVAELYLPVNRKSISALRQMERLKKMAHGFSDLEILQDEGSASQTAVSQGRFSMANLIKRNYTAEEIGDQLESAFSRKQEGPLPQDFSFLVHRPSRR